MKSKKAEIIKNDVLVNDKTGVCYNMTIKKQNDVTTVIVIGIADDTKFKFSFKDRNDLIRLTSAVIIDKEKLERKVKKAIKDLR